MQAHSQELIEDYRKAIDQIIALRARVAELEGAMRNALNARNHIESDSILFEALKP